MKGEFGKQSGGHLAPTPKNLNITEGPNFSHILSREAFQEYYNKLGKDPIQQRQEYIPEKMDIFKPYIKSPLIDLGCHIGINFKMFSSAGCKDITGVDCSSSLIAEAKKGYESSPKVTLIESLIEDLPEDKKYKTIVMTDLLEHVIDVHPVLQKAKNLLDNDGYILYSSPSTREGTASHIRGISKEEIVQWLKQYNLKVYKWLPDYGSDIRLIAQHEN